jgi:integrase
VILKPHQEEVLLFDNVEKKQGAVIRKPGSKKLYILFYYFNKRVEKSTGLNDTNKNREKVRTWLDGKIELRDAGRLVFAEAFPGAHDSEKAYFAKLEGWNYAPEPRDVLFGKYAQHWREEIWEHFDSHTKKLDYQVVIDYWLLPYFAEMPFSQITSVEVKKFMATFKWKKGKHKGKPLSKARAKNIMTVLRTIFEDAADEHQWANLHDPFRKVRENLPKTPVKVREVFRFDEWMEIIRHIRPWYRPMVEVMVMTGMIHSEIAGLRKADIRGDYLLVQNSIVLDVESDELKSRFRRRKIPVTKAIRKRLDEAASRTESEYVFAHPDGELYRREGFIERIWMPALKAAGVPYQPPYSMRHTFAAWSLTLRMDPLKLVRLMGHGSKQMVFDTYGNYVEGLEQDTLLILEYLGRDFIEPKYKIPASMMNGGNAVFPSPFMLPPTIPLFAQN